MTTIKPLLIILTLFVGVFLTGQWVYHKYIAEAVIKGSTTLSKVQVVIFKEDELEQLLKRSESSLADKIEENKSNLEQINSILAEVKKRKQALKDEITSNDLNKYKLDSIENVKEAQSELSKIDDLEGDIQVLNYQLVTLKKQFFNRKTQLNITGLNYQIDKAEFIKHQFEIQKWLRKEPNQEESEAITSLPILRVKKREAEVEIDELAKQIRTVKEQYKPLYNDYVDVFENKPRLEYFLEQAQRFNKLTEYENQLLEAKTKIPEYESLNFEDIAAVLKKSSRKTIADENGRFTINAPIKEAVYLIAFDDSYNPNQIWVVKMFLNKQQEEIKLDDSNSALCNPSVLRNVSYIASKGDNEPSKTLIYSSKDFLKSFDKEKAKLYASKPVPSYDEYKVPKNNRFQ
jgi:hypothetical protein